MVLSPGHRQAVDQDTDTWPIHAQAHGVGVPPGGCTAYNTYVTEPLFREIDHTADLGIEVEGASAHELFRRTGLALFSLMVNLEQVESRQERRRDVCAENWADLLHDWLSRLLSDFLQEGFIAREIVIDEVSPTHLRARLVGETLDYDRHEFETEIKAVTYHQLGVTQEAGRWRARVIFDV